MAFLGTTIAQARPKPRAARHRTLIKATISGLYMPDQPALVRNVSYDGLGLSTQGPVPCPGDRLAVDFANGLWVSGRVVWVAGSNFGVALDQPISVEQLEKATQRQNEVIGRTMAWQVEQAFTPRPAPPRLCWI